VKDPNLKDLQVASRALMDEVDRQLRDKRNLGPTKAEAHQQRLQGKGAVPVSKESDPLVSAARAVRDLLPDVEAAAAYAKDLRSKTDVEAEEFDEKWCGYLRDIERSVGPGVQIPDIEDPRPVMPSDVEGRLREWGLIGKERTQ